MKGRQQNTFRIIGGSHRGRRFAFPDGDIRPSPDRLRETLFNWLAPHVYGARCLDAFAGSGALGLEALSRGAEFCRFMERDKAALAAIQGHLAALRLAERADLQAGDSMQALGRTPDAPFDLVFLDPPYSAGLLPEAIENLEQNGWLRPGARIYLECRSGDALPALPANWRLEKSKQAGQVGYHLAIRE